MAVDSKAIARAMTPDFEARGAIRARGVVRVELVGGRVLLGGRAVTVLSGEWV